MSLVVDLATLGLSLLPRPIMLSLASRYIAGETLEEALGEVKRLEGEGYLTILDILGEHVQSEADARAVAQSYREAARALAQVSRDPYVSIKPTHVGLNVSEDLAGELYLEVARACGELGVFVRVEMEDHPTTDGTLRVFEQLRARADNVGLVLQSRLLRTPRDIEALEPGPLSVRMVKGIYLEPAEIAHVADEPIRRAFVECCELLFARGAQVALATHDDVLADRLLDLVRRLDVDPARYEFQVLLGVRRPLWSAWRDAGHTVRVYVPFGPQWRAYSLRRLRKNPQIFRHVLRDTLSLGRR